MAARTAISGASCKVFLASTGQEIGWATGVDVTETIQNQRVDVVGDIDSQEIVPVRRTAQMQVSAIRVSSEALEEYVWATGSTAEILNAPAFDFVVVDTQGNNTLITLEGCKPTTRTFRVDSTSLFNENLSFDVRKIRYQGE
jgi:hypothetical protein